MEQGADPRIIRRAGPRMVRRIQQLSAQVTRMDRNTRGGVRACVNPQKKAGPLDSPAWIGSDLNSRFEIRNTSFGIRLFGRCRLARDGFRQFAPPPFTRFFVMLDFFQTLHEAFLVAFLLETPQGFLEGLVMPDSDFRHSASTPFLFGNSRWIYMVGLFPW